MEFYIYLDAGNVAISQLNLVGPTSYHIQTGPINRWEESLKWIHDDDGQDLTSGMFSTGGNLEVVWSVPNKMLQCAARILFGKS